MPQIFTDWQAASPLRQEFSSLIPHKLHCADDPTDGLLTRFRNGALKYRHIQLNGPSGFRWMPFDIDRADAYFAHRDANLPPPNFIAVNTANGHAHSAILLAVPVACHSASRDAPLRFYGAVERGFARRLGADRHYAGHITKNPLHPDWRVEWRRDEPYSLEELADWLFFEDMRPDPSIQTTFGAGRNVTVFDELRQIAYREVLSFKRSGSIAAWSDRCLRLAVGINQQFPVPLGHSEVRGLVKSVSNWTWKHFSEQAFSQRQSQRGKRGMAKRWAGHQKQCLLYGLNERTYRRRKKAGTLPALPATDSGRITISDKPTTSSLCHFDRLSGRITISDRPTTSSLPCFGLTGREPPHDGSIVVPHLVRRDGFGRVPINLRWAKPMRDLAAVVAAGKAPGGLRLPSRAAA